MERDEIARWVTREVAKQFGIDEGKVVEGVSLVDDLGADSLDLVEVVMNIDEHFGIETPDEKAERILTVGQIIDAVYDAVRKKDA